MENSRRPLRVESLECRHLMASVSVESFTVQTVGDFTAPIEIRRAGGMRAAEVRLQFDPTMLKVDPANVTAGSVWGDQALVVANVDDHAGTIRAFVFSAHEVPQVSGGLLNIDFQTSEHAQAGRDLSVDLQEVRINEGQIPLDVEPVEGPDDTDTDSAQTTYPRIIEKTSCLPGEQNFDEAMFVGPRELTAVRAALDSSTSDETAHETMIGPLAPWVAFPNSHSAHQLAPSIVDEILRQTGPRDRRLY